MLGERSVCKCDWGLDFEGLKDIPGCSDFILEKVSGKMFKQGYDRKFQ